MAARTLLDKLAVLADAAKYDASCASSSTGKKNSLGTGGIGSTEGMGVCHAYAPDGRCISLLKILMTNFCIYDCRYCVNRVSSNVERARFSVDEVVKLTLDFYKRNYIEGLFLSSGIIRSSDYTMEQMVAIAKKLRVEHKFQGYIHLKTIPEADAELIRQAGLYADRLSINIELPRDDSLTELAPEKSGTTIRKAMAKVKTNIIAAKPDIKEIARSRPVAYAPAGQSTQMIVGADDSSDAAIISRSAGLYSGYDMRRVYYSAFSPIPDASRDLPPSAPPLMREHRLYQADWLMRFYGFESGEIFQRNGADDVAMLDLDIDPKLAWAVANRAWFPVDVNRGSREELLRVPGFGAKTVDRLLAARVSGRLMYDNVARIAHSMKVCRHFIITHDYHPGTKLDVADMKRVFAPKPKQLALI